MYKKSPANAKGNARQRCMFESLVRTKSKLIDPSNDITFTLTRGRQRARPVLPSHISLKSQIFPNPLSFSALTQGDPFQIYEKKLYRS